MEQQQTWDIDRGTIVQSLERKSRFEVHHTHASSVSGTPTITNGAGSHPPTLAGAQDTTQPRESSLSRVSGDVGLTRENSSTRISRFSVEPSTSSALHPEAGSSNTPVSSTGTPSPSNGALGPQSKRSRFQVSSVEGGRSTGDHLTGEILINEQLWRIWYEASFIDIDH